MGDGQGFPLMRDHKGLRVDNIGGTGGGVAYMTYGHVARQFFQA